jgi:FtsP/CotA-like multicopper oxidase with cupredoxin domain
MPASRPSHGGGRRKGRGYVFAAVLAAICLTAAFALLGRAAASNTPVAATATTYVPQTRIYYVAADEVRWNYAPDGKNDITGKAFDDTANTYVKRGPLRIGSTYIKALYREYTDATFTHLKPIPPRWQHLGMLGPVIRAVVGDHVKIVFRNNLVDRPASIHMHGLKYTKSSEGAPYADGTGAADKGDDDVAPHHTYTYNYTTPERAGPGPMDGSSIMWMYHSHSNEVADDYAGLVGPVIVTKASMARADGTPTDVDREFVMQFKVSSENQSPYLAKNIQTFAGQPSKVDPEDPDFEESNQMHSINGYVFGNQPLASMTMHKGERVRWYLMAMGTEVDLHTPHWHGNTVLANGMRTDVVSLLPASMMVADMVPDNVGTWLFHCHVNDHITAGMLTRYRVLQ